MSVGARIIELRKECNMSQGQLATAMEVSRQAVSKWENGLAVPDTQKMIRLAEVLNTEVEYLATGKKGASSPAQAPTEIIKTVEVEKVVEKVVEVEKIVEVERPETWLDKTQKITFWAMLSALVLYILWRRLKSKISIFK